MAKKRRDYSIEYKIDAARLVEDQGYQVKEACERLGVPLSTMTRWLSQYRKGKLKPGYKQAQATEAEAELKRLREANKRLEQEVAILKKASAYFARQMR